MFRNGIALATQQPSLEGQPARDQAFEHPLELLGVHLAQSIRRSQQRREPDAVEAHPDQFVKCADQIQVVRRDRDARGDLHPPLSLQQRLHPRDDSVVATRAVSEECEAGHVLRALRPG